MTDEEKLALKSISVKFLNCYYYFCTVWAYLSPHKKEKILTIIAEGKGVIPYEIIVNMESFLLE